MAEQESLEFGKADFVLLDSVTMSEFMGNLRLRNLDEAGGSSSDK